MEWQIILELLMFAILQYCKIISLERKIYVRLKF